MTTKTTEPDELYCEDCKQAVTVSCVENDHETIDARPDLNEEVARFKTYLEGYNSAVQNPTLAQGTELLRRLVERDKRNRDALKMMVELWDANHPDDPCACSDADYSVGQHAVMCETCVARACMEGRDPNADA